jgi:hypothetical protein
MIKKIFIAVCLLLIVGCEQNTGSSSNQEPYVPTESAAFKKGKRQLEVQGYKNVKEVAYPLFCCAEEDSFLLSTGFEAEDNEGNKVRGCFCVKGFIRNSVTIRFE